MMQMGSCWKLSITVIIWSGLSQMRQASLQKCWWISWFCLQWRCLQWRCPRHTYWCTCNRDYRWKGIGDLAHTEVDKKALLNGSGWKMKWSMHPIFCWSKQKSATCRILFLARLWGRTKDEFVRIDAALWIPLGGSEHNWDSTSHVCVYNSMYTALPVSTKVQISALLQTEKESITLEWANVHKQPNGHDCGLFAIAFATALCHRQMAEQKFFLSYNLDSTFMSASTTNTFRHFQLEERVRRRQRKRKPFMFIATAGLQPRYIEMMCDGCHEWYDEQCEVIPAAAWANPDLKRHSGKLVV